jgi:hypothetical protein
VALLRLAVPDHVGLSGEDEDLHGKRIFFC